MRIQRRKVSVQISQTEQKWFHRSTPPEVSRTGISMATHLENAGLLLIVIMLTSFHCS